MHKGIFIEDFSKVQLKLLCFRHTFRGLYFLCPVIGAFHHIEFGCRRRIIYLPEFNPC